MPKFFRFFTSEAFIITAISLIVMLVNITPFLYRLYHTLPDREFTGAQFYTLDYNIYLGHFKEGAKGVWLTHNKHSSEPHNGLLLRREYIIWGFLTGYLLHLPIIYVYHSARIFAGFLLLLVIYLLIKEIFPTEKKSWKNQQAKTINQQLAISNCAIIPNKSKRIFAFLLTTIIAGFPIYNIDPNTGKQTLDLHLYWFLEIDATQRFATLFHYLLGNIILLSVIILFIRFLKHQNPITDQPINQNLKSEIRNPITKTFHTLIRNPLIRNALISIILCILAALIHPSTLVTIYLMFGIYWTAQTFVLIFLSIFKKGNFKQYLKVSIYIISIILFSAPSILFLKSQVSTFPWTIISRWDKATQTPIDLYDYIYAIGPIFFLGMLGAGFILIKGLSQYFNLILELLLKKKKPPNPQLITSKQSTSQPFDLDQDKLVTSQSVISNEPALSEVERQSAIGQLTIRNPQPATKQSINLNAQCVMLNALIFLFCFPLATFLLAFRLWPYLLDINRVRFLQVPIFVPFAIFSVIALSNLTEIILPVLHSIACYFSKNIKKILINTFFSKKIKPATSQPFDFAQGKLATNRLSLLLFTFYFLFLFYLTFPSLKWGLIRETFMFLPGDGLVYQGKEWMKGLYWLDKNTKPEEVVMGGFLTNGLIPGFTGNYAYSGHPWNTVNFEQKENNIYKFFRTGFSPKEASALLKKDHVNYIFYGYQEKSYGGLLGKYQKFLKVVYNTPEVTIYKVL